MKSKKPLYIGLLFICLITLSIVGLTSKLEFLALEESVHIASAGLLFSIIGVINLGAYYSPKSCIFFMFLESMYEDFHIFSLYRKKWYKAMQLAGLGLVFLLFGSIALIKGIINIVYYLV